MADSSVLFQNRRVEKFWVDVLNEREEYIEPLDGVVSGSVACSVDARIKRGGSLEIVSKKPINWWGRKRLRIWIEVNGYRWSLGVFIPSSPEQKHNGDKTSFTVEISDKLLILDDDKIPYALTIPKGTNLTSWVENYIRSTGETKIYIAPSQLVNKRPLVWDAATEMLTVINDILDYIGYFSLSVSPEGTFSAEPYMLPADRPVMWDFREGVNSVQALEYTFSQDLTGIPNRIVYTTDPQDQDKKPLVSSWENHDPDSPFSYEARGRWITEVKTDAEAADQAELDKMVKRRANRSLRPMAKIDLKSAALPVALNQVVRYTDKHYRMMMTIRKFEVSLKPGELMSMTLRKANREY